MHILSWKCKNKYLMRGVCKIVDGMFFCSTTTENLNKNLITDDVLWVEKAEKIFQN